MVSPHSRWRYSGCAFVHIKKICFDSWGDTLSWTFVALSKNEKAVLG